MSRIDAVAFMAGYLHKEAENGLMDFDPQIVKNNTSQDVANQYLSPDQNKGLSPQDRTQIGQAVQNSSANKFLDNQQNRDLTTMGGGAALGGTMGYMLGGDLGSALMGTALGGLVGWLAKHFFGSDVNKAYDWAQKKFNEGTAEAEFKRLKQSNPAAGAEAEAKGIDTKQAKLENAKKQAQKKIKEATGEDNPLDNAEVAEAVKIVENANKAIQNVEAADPYSAEFPLRPGTNNVTRPPSGVDGKPLPFTQPETSTGGPTTIDPFAPPAGIAQSPEQAESRKAERITAENKQLEEDRRQGKDPFYAPNIFDPTVNKAELFTPVTAAPQIGNNAPLSPRHIAN